MQQIYNAKLKELILTKLENIKVETEEIFGQLIIKVSKENLFGVCRALKEGSAFEFDYLSFISAIDMMDHLELVYQLISTEKNHSVRIKVAVPRDNPQIDSVVSLWIGADWHERETFDLFGVVFTNHPNLTRILTAEGFTGFPFRKDFKHPDLIRMPND